MLVSVGFFLGLSALAAISYRQLPLYSGNQNQYFVHGLASAALGLLKDDWFAHTVDDTPVFSFLVTVTYRYGHEALFYLYYALLVGVYAYGLLGIVTSALHAGDSRMKQWISLCVIIVIHSLALQVISERALRLNSLSLLTYGVADQFIPGNILQPSLFGVLLILSVRAFLESRPHLAVFLAALAATIHPTYLLAAGALGCSYLIEEFRSTKSLRHSVGLGFFALVMVLPVIAHVYASFRPTSPEVYALAGHLRMNTIFPYHMLLARWLGPAAYLKTMLVLGAIILVRRTPLFTVLAVSFLAAIGLTAAQVLSRSLTLALILPWRLSVYLVPIASSIVLADAAIRVVDVVTRRSTRARSIVVGVIGVAVLTAVLGGLAGMKLRVEEMAKDPSMPMMRFVARTRARGDVFLIPVGLERFRILTGTPIFVDWKSVPLKDTEVLEWERRFEMAEGFYRLRGEEACRLLSSITAEYGITHVVVEGPRAQPGCMESLYDDGHYGVYRVVR